MRVLLKLQTLAGLLATLGLVSQASALVVVTGAPTDTVTDLSVVWSWDAAGGTGSYSGVHWNAVISTAFFGGTWLVASWYQHLDGPHGEAAEGAWHTHSGSFVAGTGFGMGGVDDHYAPTLHADFHRWGLTANGPAVDPSMPVPPGFATLMVQHPVPEPATYALLALGLAAVLTRRRLQRQVAS